MEIVGGEQLNDRNIGIHITENHITEYTEAQFSLPCHAWNELTKTCQFQEFEKLLLEYQKGNIRT